MTPFFVVDRPISLEILNGYWSTRPGFRYGLMASVSTTSRFRKLFAKYPCNESRFCEGHTESPGNAGSFQPRPCSRQDVIKIGDSGIFGDAERLSYEELFKRYEEMDVDYGVMVDYLLDAELTLESAAQAVEVYKHVGRSFRLVLVAQGNDLGEYLDCYRRLRELGDFPIAIGGMLRRKVNSARYFHVYQPQFLNEVLRSIRQKFDPQWLFVLGVYHPDRHENLASWGVTGADYKGWIFNYKHRRDVLSNVLSPLRRTPAVESHPRLRQVLYRRELLLAQLKNRDAALRGNLESGQSNLAKGRKKGTLRLIGNLDNEILKLMTNLYHRDGLGPAEYPPWEDALTVLRSSDQQVRFSGVHDYLNTRVFPKLTAKQGYGTVGAPSPH